MSAVGTGVLAKLQTRLPNMIGNNRQWSSAYISALIQAAYNMAEERIGMTWMSQEITLSNNTNEYDVASKFIEVVTVEFALDGTTYSRELRACTFDDFDRVSTRWREDTCDEPFAYALFSTPGTQNVTGAPASGFGCRITVYPYKSVAGGSKIKLSGWGIGTSTTNIPEDVQERVIIPYIMAVLRAEHDVGEARMHYEKFRVACEDVKGRYISPLGEQAVRLGD